MRGSWFAWPLLRQWARAPQASAPRARPPEHAHMLRTKDRPSYWADAPSVVASRSGDRMRLARPVARVVRRMAVTRGRRKARAHRRSPHHGPSGLASGSQRAVARLGAKGTLCDGCAHFTEGAGGLRLGPGPGISIPSHKHDRLHSVGDPAASRLWSPTLPDIRMTCFVLVDDRAGGIWSFTP